MTLVEKYTKHINPIGFSADSAFSGMLVYWLEDEDSDDHYVLGVVDWYMSGSGEKYGRFNRHTVLQTNAGRNYFWHNNRRCYLDEIERCCNQGW